MSKAVSRFDGPTSRTLRQLVPQPLHRELNIRSSKHRIVHTSIQTDRVIRRFAGARKKSADVPAVKFFRLPGMQSLRNLLGKALRITRRTERLLGQDRRCLMMPMSIPICPRKASHEYVRTKCPNRAHQIPQRDVVPLPLLKCLLRRLRISKIRHTRKSLLDSVITIRRQKFQSPQHAQHIEQIAAQLVLPTFAARQGHQ